LDKVSKQVSKSIEGGAKLVTGGRGPEQSELKNGFFYLPTILTDTSEDSPIVAEECFGPALPVVAVKSMDEAIELANDSIYGLGASVWTKDLGMAKKAASDLQAGTVLINSLYGAGGWEIEVPMGGFKQSGIGREYGIEGLESYTETKTIIMGA
ncbi:MAG: aldehyde dehydrogenase family protein, partial [Nitrososphaerota archaeon]|nr:aldehyde dehydrogenase family protein [Nitrososphaerota archaeon]